MIRKRLVIATLLSILALMSNGYALESQALTEPPAPLESDWEKDVALEIEKLTKIRTKVYIHPNSRVIDTTAKKVIHVPQKKALQFQQALAESDFSEIKKIFKDVGLEAVPSLVNYCPLGSFPPLSFISISTSLKNATELAQLLVKNGARVNSHFGEINNPITTAVRHSNLPMLKFLLEHKAKIPKGLLDHAASLLDKSLARELIKQRGLKPSLFAAISLQERSMLDEVLQRSKNRDLDLAWAMKVAIKDKNIELIQTLLAHGAKLTLHSAALLNDGKFLSTCSPTKEELNDRLTFSNAKLLSPLELALSLDNKDAVMELIRLRAKTNEILQNAVMIGDLPTLLRLQEACANFRYVYRDGRSIVMIALMVLQGILKEKAQEKLIDLEESIQNMKNVLLVLRAGGANLAQADRDGLTATDYAISLPDHELRQEMLSIINN